MPTQSQYDSLRFDFDLEPSSLDDTTIDALYARDEVVAYVGKTAVQDAFVRYLLARKLRTAAAREVDYVQGSAAVKASQRHAQLRQLEQDYLAKLEQAVEDDYPGVMFGALRRAIATQVEYPNDVTEEVD